MDVIVYGGGKFAGNIIDDFKKKINPIGYIDNSGNTFLENKYGIKFLGKEIDKSMGCNDVVLCVGSEKDLFPRKRCFIKLKEMGFNMVTLIHDSSVISDRAFISEGTLVQSLCTIQSNVFVGIGGIVSANCFLGHDSMIDNFVFVGPGVNMGGSVVVGESTHIGIGATIIQKIHVGSRCLIGASCCVIRDVPNDCRVLGVPGVISDK